MEQPSDMMAYLYELDNESESFDIQRDGSQHREESQHSLNTPQMDTGIFVKPCASVYYSTI